MAKEIPVYLFTGFLEAGKTKTIQETLEDEAFNTGERTLLLVCETGIEEYDEKRFSGKNVIIEEIENEKDLNEKALSSLARKNKIERVLIEYNGMWQLKSLYEAVPPNWLIYQQLLFVDAQSFINYNSNMRSLVVDKLTNCELVVFNRPDESTDKDTFHKIVRGISRRTLIAYEYPDGTLEYDEKEDPLPFDIDAPIIEIADRDYAIWFRDFAEDIKKYEGKTIRFKGIVGINKNMAEGVCICGRHVMTCCIDDIEFKGLVCVDKPVFPVVSNRDWVIMTATIAIEYNELYRKSGPVLHVTAIEKSSVPEMEIATFY